jgi:hypothetical protein
LEVTFLPPFVNFCFFFGWGRKDAHASVDARHMSHLVIFTLTGELVLPVLCDIN